MTSADSFAGLPGEYAVLRKRVADAGLLRRQPGYFTRMIVVNALLLSASVTILLLTDNVFVQLLNAAFLAFVYGQIGLLGHDAGHRQIFASALKNDLVSYPCALALGISAGGWIEKHNRHHAHSNRHDLDPDIEFPVVAFSEEQVERARGLKRFCIRYQSWLFFPLLSLVSLSLRKEAIRWIIQTHIRQTWLDVAVVAAHYALYLLLVFWALPLWTGVLFIAVHQCLWGFYMGSVFAPNHKGMLMLDADDKIDFVREQVLTSRNVRPGLLTDYWYGGLNYQIEHHLFPTMPRNNLGKARVIVKAYCEERGIPYHETGVVRSYAEILADIHRLALLARRMRA